MVWEGGSREAPSYPDLGHLLLHRDLPRSHWDGNVQGRRLEAQASAFASALLLPAEALKGYRGPLELGDVLALTRQWGVPVETVLARGQTLGTLGEDEARRLWQNYRRRSAQAPAPSSAAWLDEVPRLLREALERLLETGVQSRAQVRHALALLPEEIEALAGAPRGVLQDPPLSEIIRLKSPK